MAVAVGVFGQAVEVACNAVVAAEPAAVVDDPADLADLVDLAGLAPRSSKTENLSKSFLFL